ncbi:MAG: CehA/McbA family metallohydrolase [Rhodobiaceae bacterium]|jgi:hypothetical protein|nr:CehA/McbA family metallohydrolase [Rhodobiaceae bacterium]MBT5518243.1 CehA/McbA family metallohydrolase [Rhodobiaceae bacterium]MBT7279401.1 CehA/McbA family metallohydrolase [Rhodobiaceae bacterium]
MSRFSSLSFFTTACLIGLLTGFPASAKAQIAATQITAANAKQWVQKGPDAVGGIGDWVLSNGTLCIVFAGLAHEGDFSAVGGTLRDIGYCARDDDQFVSAQDLLNGSLSQPVNISDIRATQNAKTASLVTLGEHHGLFVETRFTLSLDRPERMKISKTIWRQNEEATNPGLFSSAMLNYQSMETFLLSTKDPALSNGFVQKRFVGRGPLTYTQTARPVDTIILLSPHDARQPVSYGWRITSAKLVQGEASRDLPSFALADHHALAFVTLAQPFFFGDSTSLGLSKLMQLALMEIELGDKLQLEEEIWVTPSADVSSVTDLLFADAAELQGQVTPTGQSVRVHIDRADGAPFTQVSADAQGRFAAKLPAGDYSLRMMTQAADVVRQSFTMGETETKLAPLTPPRAARIELPRGHAMRLAFRGQNTTPNPDFEDSLTGYRVEDGDGPIEKRRASDVHLAGVPSDPAYVYLPDGDYLVYAVQGPEFSVETSALKVRDGKNTTLRIDVPKRVLTTPHHMSVDMHVHASPSTDNSFSTEKRVRTFVAERGEVMVGSEHDTIFDFNPLLRKLGVTDKMIAVTGSEVTSSLKTARAPYSIGHMNFFPLEEHSHANRRGLKAHENRRTRDVLHDMHVHYNDPVAQLNHPRANFALSHELPDDFETRIEDEQFFTHMGVAAHPYQPHLPLTSHPNNSLIAPDPITGVRDIDFDVMEIMNGSQDHRPDRVAAARLDWLSLLAQGEKLAATANSDSHNTTQQVALPRNMVRMNANEISQFRMARFTQAVKSGAFYGTTGPFLDLALDKAQIGQTHRGASGVLRGRVFSADWARADTLKVQLNGKTIHTQPLPEDGTFALPMDFQQDGFVTLEVSGPASETYKAIYPRFFPYAYSNPIYVDANGDGKWTPPGLPKP